MNVVENQYDYMSRRIVKATSSSTNKFLYDGWNKIQEFQVSGFSSQVSAFVWGIDLSGTLQGAGGIGGLLCAIQGTNTYFVVYDANGNVAEYLAPDGSVVAHYEYDPYGNIMAQSGSKADEFIYRFSTKYTDDETGLLYYGFRFYSPGLGRWASRDPIGERGGHALYSYVDNNPINASDLLGAKKRVLCEEVYTELRQYNAIKILFIIKIWYLYNVIDLGHTFLYCDIEDCCTLDWPNAPKKMSETCVVSWPDGLMKDCTVIWSFAATKICP